MTMCFLPSPPDAGAVRSMRKEPSESESRGMRCKFLNSLNLYPCYSLPRSRQAQRVMELRGRHICHLSCARGDQSDAPFYTVLVERGRWISTRRIRAITLPVLAHILFCFQALVPPLRAPPRTPPFVDPRRIPWTSGRRREIASNTCCRFLQ